MFEKQNFASLQCHRNLENIEKIPLEIKPLTVAYIIYLEVSFLFVFQSQPNDKVIYMYSAPSLLSTPLPPAEHVFLYQASYQERTSLCI